MASDPDVRFKRDARWANLNPSRAQKVPDFAKSQRLFYSIRATTLACGSRRQCDRLQPLSLNIEGRAKRAKGVTPKSRAKSPVQTGSSETLIVPQAPAKLV